MNDLKRHILNGIESSDIYELAICSPIERADGLSARLANEIYFKREDLQPVFSFKLRGAYHKLNLLSDNQKKQGVITASAGNHAQGVALGAKKLGIKSLIVMPVTTPEIKVNAVKIQGAEVILHGDSYDDALKLSHKLAKQDGYVFIHPFDDAEVIAGQGTIAKEIISQLGDTIDAIFVAVGGGGLLAGILTYIKSLHPKIKVIGIESEESACLSAAMKAGKRVILDSVGIFADGVAVKQVGKLPFELTNAQKNVIREIRKDFSSKAQMNRLLQGDVGSGKTVVALLTSLIAIDNNYQVCFMAPTEILAQQHFNSLNDSLRKINVKVEILTGSSSKIKRKDIFENLQNGNINILVGTHAVLEDNVIFKNLGYVIIDEQHKFGVAQRSKLWKKNNTPPHVLVMTATPIPRTLAMSVYGDLDISVIDELPPGRKPVKTVHRTDKNRLDVFKFLKEEISKGRQVYIVYPLIEESKKLDYKDLMDGYESISREFPNELYQISILHGRMKPDDKAYEMERFKNGQTQIMVSTTVIEVGVNIPNASVMVIESSEKFGLSQLHQLRGRVGRGSESSFCILMSSFKLSNDAKKRIKTMTSTNDGFKVAEVDMEIRGPGNLLGTQQSGILDFKIANIINDKEILESARKDVKNLISIDPSLSNLENKLIKKEFLSMRKNSLLWKHIS